MEISFKTQSTQAESNTLIYFVDDSKDLGGALKALDADKSISNAIEHSPHFQWNEGQVLHIVAPSYCKAAHLFIISFGDKTTVNNVVAQKIGAKITDILNQYKLSKATLTIEADSNLGKALSINLWAQLLMGSQLKNYVFNKHFITKKKEHQLSLQKLEVISANAELISNAYNPLAISTEGVFLARDLATEPANVIYPASFALQCQELNKLGVKVTVLDEKQMKDLGMGALLGVGKASSTESRTVVMEWKPANYQENSPTIALAGKGVCFDSGGLNIKSAASNIADMKDDKAGAAVVTGTMYAVAKRKLNVHAVGIIGLVENMIAGNAQRPSDVVHTMSGQTVEVENTDAEGRLVLCDIMWYVQEHYKPHYLLDIATLTGAVTMALGENGYAGLFSNDDAMADEVLRLGKETGEIFWRLPLAEHFDKQIDSEIADMRNTGTARGAGATIAAQFLQRFVQKGCKWAHLDIANVAWNKKGSAISPKGSTGFGVRILEAFIDSHAK